MNDRFLQLLGVIAAIVVTVAGVLAYFGNSLPFIDDRPAAEPAAAPAERAPTPAGAAPSAAGAPAIYRCDDGGKVTYSDQPCQGGRVVDLLVTEGYQAPRAPGEAPPAFRPAPPPARERAAPPPPGNSAVECSMIGQAITSLDDAVRRGGPSVHKDDLRQRRRTLVERRQALNR
jgi:hypothetical protein